MAVANIDPRRIKRAKRSFSTRRVLPEDMHTLLTGNLRPNPGDLVLARIDMIGKQTKLELTDGRRAHLFPGDEIIVSYGNRYAPDQYEAVVATDLSPCDLVAAGGIAGIELARHQRMIAPTKLSPVGLLGDAHGNRLNLKSFAVEATDEVPRIPAILSLGTSMNAGKTLTATSLVRGLKRMGYSVAALKITGTGSGGDMWIVRDAGADVSLDFGDAGFATTYLTPLSEIERGAFRLLNHSADLGCDIAVIEIADGLQQLETSQLIRSRAIRQITIGAVFAAYDAMGAKHGVDVLREVGHSVLGMSGRLGRSPLGVREAEAATGLRLYSPWELQDGALMPAIREQAARCSLEPGFAHLSLGRIADEVIPVPHGNVAPQRHTATPFRSSAASRTGPEADMPRRLLGCIAANVMHREVSGLCAAPFGKRLQGRTTGGTVFARPTGRRRSDRSGSGFRGCGRDATGRASWRMSPSRRPRFRSVT